MIKKKITQNLILICISLILMLLFLEILIRSIVDNGMNYDIEMMKYSKTLKIKSENLRVGIEHERNKEAVLMGQKIVLNDYGFRNDRSAKNQKNFNAWRLNDIWMGEQRNFFLFNRK